ncbi:MAG TPA: glycosyltransferase family 4 protein [Ignavibacteria bacterium]|nr:glycosyltransferase family 4 protein [Ignavibacteria bacterium]
MGNNGITIALILILAGIASFSLTGLIKTWALRLNVVNEPTSRGLHSTVTPRGGGLAFIIAWYIGIFLLYRMGIVDQQLFLALLCGLALGLVSLLDDIFDIKPLIRLLVHFGVAIAAFYFLGGLRKPITFGIDVLSVPFITYPLAIIGMVWFINLYNFMDGADGFASLEAISVGIVLFIFNGSYELLLLVAVVIGFLYWNWPKAKIFMGDVGSTQLGFILVILGIHYHNTLDFSIFNWLMITAPFWFDATLTLYRRWRNGEQLSQPHRKHAYQRFVRAGYSHLMLDIILIVINIFIFILIVLYREWDFLKIPVYITTLFFLYFLTRRVDKLTSFKD